MLSQWLLSTPSLKRRSVSFLRVTCLVKSLRLPTWNAHKIDILHQNNGFIPPRFIITSASVGFLLEGAEEFSLLIEIADCNDEYREKSFFLVFDCCKNRSAAFDSAIFRLFKTFSWRCSLARSDLLWLMKIMKVIRLLHIAITDGCCRTLLSWRDHKQHSQQPLISELPPRYHESVSRKRNAYQSWSIHKTRGGTFACSMKAEDDTVRYWIGRRLQCAGSRK